MSTDTTDVLANGTEPISSTGASRRQTGKAVPQDADAGNELCFEEIGKECANVTTDTTEQCMKFDLNSNYAGQCDTAIDSKDSNSILGQIRTTVCQAHAQLLMRQKLKQYIGLVGQAEHGEQPTKVEDLQGFGDMVYFQVEDILKKFQGLKDLEKNIWKVVSELEAFPKTTKVS
ncbi:hypothetical protein EMCRGX_G026356 [Ephydatia muelleri]